MNTQPPKIPLAVFRKMARSLSADELAKLPPEKLPDRIPVDFLESLDPETSRTIDALILAQQMSVLEKQRSQRQKLGPELASALSLAGRNEDDTPVGQLRRRLARFLNRVQSNVGKSISTTQALDHLQALERHRDLVGRVQDEYQVLTEARKLLREALFKPLDEEPEIRAAEAKLAQQSEVLCQLLGRYFAERCKLCLVIMQGYRKRLQRESDLRLEIGGRLDVLTRGQAVTDEADAGERRQLHNEIRALYRKMRRLGVLIDESDLTYWMDIVVDFGLYRRADTQYGALVDRSAEELGRLMETYFSSAEQLQFSQPGDRYAPVPMNRGEQYEQSSAAFLRSYLDRRQPAIARQGCVSAADRAYAISRIKRVLGV